MLEDLGMENVLLRKKKRGWDWDFLSQMQRHLFKRVSVIEGSSLWSSGDVSDIIVLKAVIMTLKSECEHFCRVNIFAEIVFVVFVICWVEKLSMF